VKNEIFSEDFGVDNGNFISARLFIILQSLLMGVKGDEMCGACNTYGRNGTSIQNFSQEEPGIKTLVRLGADVRLTLNCTLRNKQGVNTYKYVNETSNPRKGRKFLDHLCYHQTLKQCFLYLLIEGLCIPFMQKIEEKL
jgi:hypothetical protein